MHGEEGRRKKNNVKHKIHPTYRHVVQPGYNLCTSSQATPRVKTTRESQLMKTVMKCGFPQVSVPRLSSPRLKGAEGARPQHASVDDDVDGDVQGVQRGPGGL